MATRKNTPAEHVETIFLVIKSNMQTRIAKPRGNTGTVRLAQDEVAIKINLIFPRSWASVIGSMDISVPDNTPMFTWQAEEDDVRGEAPAE